MTSTLTDALYCKIICSIIAIKSKMLVYLVLSCIMQLYESLSMYGHCMQSSHLFQLFLSDANQILLLNVL